MRASSSVGALDKRSGDEHHVIGSFSTDPEEDNIILNEENLRPEYSQTEDTATHDGFRLQGIMSSLKEKRAECAERELGYSNVGFVSKCTEDCFCKSCETCARRPTS